MADPQISIIVPVYNVEAYIERCIRSITEQDALVWRYEVIAINDGSTDSSLAKLQQLKREYPRLQVIDMEHREISAARNRGLQVATGEYLMFVDSDDAIVPGTLSYLLDAIEIYRTDIILFIGEHIFPSGKSRKLISHLSPHGSVLTLEEYTNRYTIRSSACFGLFRRELIEKANFRFKDGFDSEDIDYAVRIYACAGSIVCLHKTLYNYYARFDSITQNKIPARLFKLAKDKAVMLGELDIFIRRFEGKRYAGLKRKLEYISIDIIREMLRNRLNRAERRELLGLVREAGYYPVPKGSYQWQYSLFRLLTCRPWLIDMYAAFGLGKMF